MAAMYSSSEPTLHQHVAVFSRWIRQKSIAGSRGSKQRYAFQPLSMKRITPVLVLLVDLVLYIDDGGVCCKVRVRVVPANTPAHRAKSGRSSENTPSLQVPQPSTVPIGNKQASHVNKH